MSGDASSGGALHEHFKYQDPKNETRYVGGDHYKNMTIEPWDVVDTWPISQQIGFYRGGALKYLMRMGAKDESLQELKKGRAYLEKLIKILDRMPAPTP